MRIKNTILDFAFKNQKLIEGLAIFMVFLGVSFTFEQSNTTWAWNNYPYIALIFAILSVILIIIWVRIERHNTQKAINSIQNMPKISNNHNLLTNRQHQVYDLIILKKSNKEICNELFIEISTLKTHINKIYKIMDVKSRKELINKKEYK